MRTAVRLPLSCAWLVIVTGVWAAAAQAQTQPQSSVQGLAQGLAKPQAQPVPRLAAKPEEPIPFNRTSSPRPAHAATAKPEAPRTTGKAPAPASPPASAPARGGHAGAGAAQNEPLPLPPKPPAVPPPPPPPPKAAEKLPEPEKPEGQPSKLPRFASLRSDDVNMRVGPGARYRIEWVYKRRDLPVEILREFDVWRYVRDADGIQGWMQQATLMGRRTFIVQSADATLREEAKETAPAVAVLKAGVVGRIRSCEAASDWCQVQAGSYRGYLRREQFWGTLPHEVVNP